MKPQFLQSINYLPPPPQRSLEDTNFTSVTDLDQHLVSPTEVLRKVSGSSVSQSQTHSSRAHSRDNGSRAAFLERKEMELEEMKAEQQRMMEETARTLREDHEQAERMHWRDQKDHEEFQRVIEQTRREHAEELKEFRIAVAQQKEELRRLQSENLDLNMSNAEMERARSKGERARVVAETARANAERELIRIKTECQRVQSETALQRSYSSKASMTWGESREPFSQHSRTSVTATSFQLPTVNTFLSPTTQRTPMSYQQARDPESEEILARLEGLRMRSLANRAPRSQGISSRPREQMDTTSTNVFRQPMSSP